MEVPTAICGNVENGAPCKTFVVVVGMACTREVLWIVLVAVQLCLHLNRDFV